MSRLVLQVKQGSPAGLFREVRNSCSLIFFGKPGRRVDNASDAHRKTRYGCAAIGKERHSDLEYTTLDPRVRPAKCPEATERSGLPGARVDTRPIRKKCRERAARYNRAGVGVEAPGPGHPDGAAERVLCCVRRTQ